MALSPITCRQFARLSEPMGSTIEQINGANLKITITLPVGIVNRYAALIPNSGPDTLIINYTDNLGQAQILTYSLTLWMSDAGYVFISSDGGTQLLVAGVNGAFFDANAANVNARNVTAAATALLPACNSGYDGALLLPNQVQPTVWIMNGVTMQNGVG